MTDREAGQSPHPGAISDLYALWGIQENLLQSYRILFITVQSIFLSVAAAVASSGAPLFSLFIAIPGLFIMTKWTTFTRIRGHCVDIVQGLIKEAENGALIPHPLQNFKDQQRDMKPRAPNRKQKTRYWLEVRLPRFFWGAWFLLILIAMGMFFLQTRWGAPANQIIDDLLGRIMG